MLPIARESKTFITKNGRGHINRIAAILATAACLASWEVAEATAINYSVTVTVEASSGTLCGPMRFALADVPVTSPTCFASPGDKWFGRFQIERDLSSEPDGLYAVPFKSFYIETDEIIWDARRVEFSRGLPNVLSGYRGYDGPDINGFPTAEEGWQLISFAPQMGLLVKDGRVFAFAGDVHTHGDMFSFEFAYQHDNPIVSDRFLIESEAMGGFVVGRVAISRIPTPATLALLALGAFAGWFGARRRGLKA